MIHKPFCNKLLIRFQIDSHFHFQRFSSKQRMIQNHIRAIHDIFPIITTIKSIASSNPGFIDRSHRLWIFCLLPSYWDLQINQRCIRSPMIMMVHMLQSELMLISGRKFLLLRLRPHTLLSLSLIINCRSNQSLNLNESSNSCFSSFSFWIRIGSIHEISLSAPWTLHDKIALAIEGDLQCWNEPINLSSTSWMMVNQSMSWRFTIHSISDLVVIPQSAAIPPHFWVIALSFFSNLESIKMSNLRRNNWRRDTLNWDSFRRPVCSQLVNVEGRRLLDDVGNELVAAMGWNQE